MHRSHEEMCCSLLPGLLTLLDSPLGSAELLSVTRTKAVILLLACANASHADRIERLLLRWAPAAKAVYTHHFALIRWALSNFYVSLELRAAFVRTSSDASPAWVLSGDQN